MAYSLFADQTIGLPLQDLIQLWQPCRLAHRYDSPFTLIPCALFLDSNLRQMELGSGMDLLGLLPILGLAPESDPRHSEGGCESNGWENR